MLLLEAPERKHIRPAVKRLPESLFRRHTLNCACSVAGERQNNKRGTLFAQSSVRNPDALDGCKCSYPEIEKLLKVIVCGEFWTDKPKRSITSRRSENKE